MDESGNKSLEDVYKKWEKKGEERRLNLSRNQPNAGNVVQPGRAAWVQRFDSTSLLRRRSTKKRNHQDPYKCTNLSVPAPVESKFRLTPPVVEDIHRSDRPFFITGCSICSQKSKVMFITEKSTNSPLRNLLDLSVFCRKNLFRTVFSDVLYVANLPRPAVVKERTDIRKAVLESSSVSSTLQKLSSTHVLNSRDKQEEDTKQELPPWSPKEINLEARRIINTMSSSIKRYLVRLSTWFLLKFFGRIVSSIQVHQGQIAMLREASKRNVPLVYLPLHKSHVDYVLLSFILSCYGLKVPYIAAGDNLKDIPIISWLMRNMGGFFMKRSLKDTAPQNELYRVILNEYIAQILNCGNSLEVYIEGTRSRSGKCYSPKTGVLSSIVAAVREGQVSDVLIVPVNISYERILESGFAGELLGEPKKKESFRQTVKSVWRIFWSFFGQIRVDFGLPFSLTEFIGAAETSEACQRFMDISVAKSNTVSTPDSIMKSSASELSLDTLDRSSLTLAKCIAHHVIYNCVNCSTIMGTNMVAFLLLTRFRKGVKLPELSSALEQLKKAVLIHRRDYGFSGCNEAVVFHSINLLGKDLVCFNSETGLIRPNLSLPGVLRLMYYANQVVSVFALEAVLACSIGALLADKNISLSGMVYQNVTITRTELLDTCLDLCDLLHREFVFFPPCVLPETCLIEAIEGFIAADILTVCEDQSAKSREKQWANRLAASTAFDDGSEEEEGEIQDQDYKVNSSEDAIKALLFFRSILAPIIESYWFVACSFLWLRNKDFTESDFLQEVHDLAKSRVESGTALYSESCSLECLTNAVKVFKECNILSTNHQDPLPSPLKVRNGYESENEIINLIRHIGRYKN